jgi:hypothetical protein
MKVGTVLCEFGSFVRTLLGFGCDKCSGYV